MKKTTFRTISTVLTILVFIIGLLPQSSASAAPSLSLSVVPNTWNVIGLDSNTPGSGPYRFPVGATVCSSVATTNVSVQLVWEDNTYAADIYLRSGSLPTILSTRC